MTKKEFMPLYVGLCDLVGKESKQAGAELYYNAVKELNIIEFEKAILEVTKNKKIPSMPMPAEVLECANGSADTKALEAWEWVEFAMSYHGQYKSVSFEDKAIMRAIRLAGGWIRLCTMSDDDLKWAKKDFLSAYKNLHGKPSEITHLEGIAELENKYQPTFSKMEKVYFVGKNKKKPMLLENFKEENTPKMLKALIQKVGV